MPILKKCNVSCFFVAVIEHLPSELTDRFTELREMDLSIQSMSSPSPETMSQPPE
jgi:hypothetical protein